MSDKLHAPVTQEIQRLVAAVVEAMKTYGTPTEAEKMVADFVAKEAREIHELSAQQLAACDCAAMLDTEETHGGNKTVQRGNPFWSPAFESVMRRTAECIELRKKLAYAEAEWQAQAEMVKENADRAAAFAEQAGNANLLLKGVQAERDSISQQLHAHNPGSTEAGYIFNQMRKAFVALGGSEHEFKAHKLAELAAQLAKENETANEQRAKDINENANLMKQVAVLREALEYYAKEDHWSDETTATEGGDESVKIITSNACIFFDNGDCWRKAQDALSNTPAAASAELATLRTELLDTKENAARQSCHTSIQEKDYLAFRAGQKLTDSGAISSNAELLRELAEAGRFRIVAETGRMIVGFWPENDPDAARQPAPKEQPHA